MLKIAIISLGRLKEKYLREASEEYIKRLGRLCRLSITELDPVKLPEKPSSAQVSAALEAEGRKICEKIPSGARIIPLCIEGKLLSSEMLSEYFSSAAMECGEICFIIGSSYGLSPGIKAMGDLRLSMSPMTFPHQLARIMLLEQIYRSLKISSGETYHK